MGVSGPGLIASGSMGNGGSGGLLGSKASSSARSLSIASSVSAQSTSGPKSAHDALLTAAAEAAGLVEPQREVKEAAWGGVGERKASQQHRQQVRPQRLDEIKPSDALHLSSTAPPVLAPRGGVSAGYHLPQQTSQTQIQPPNDTSSSTRKEDIAANFGRKSGHLSLRPGSQNGVLLNAERSSPDVTSRVPLPQASRGIRGLSPSRKVESVDVTPERITSASAMGSTAAPPTKAHQHVEPPVIESDGDGDGQMRFMSRKARERAEKRRAEEEARMAAQREGAARRLRQLEVKMQSSPPPSNPASVSGTPSKSTPGPSLNSLPDAVEAKSRSIASNENAKKKTSGVLPSTATPSMPDFDRSQLPSNGGLPHHVVVPAPSDRPNWRQRTAGELNSRSSSGGGGGGDVVVLERLGRTKRGSSSTPPLATTTQQIGGHSVGVRTLFDPNRTYSSLVGGSKGGLGNNGISANISTAQSSTGVPRTKSIDSHAPKSSNSDSSPPHSNSPQSGRERHPPPPVSQIRIGPTSSVTEEDRPPVPVIHLSSYEDRDRGESRTTSSTPRMLFDPKSGSMVAAPAPRGGAGGLGNSPSVASDDVAAGVTGKGRKERTKPKGRNGRDSREENAVTSIVRRPAENGPSRDQIETGGGGNRRSNNGAADTMDDGPIDSKSSRRSRGGRSNRDDNSAPNQSQRRERGRGRPDRDGRTDIGARSGQSPAHDNDDAVGAPSRGGSRHYNGSNRNGRNGGPNRKNNSSISRIPRTCGVLYEVDTEGNYSCADECDPDQGYGAHSVPGGKVKNPGAYAQFLESRRKFSESSQLMHSNVSSTLPIRDFQQDVYYHGVLQQNQQEHIFQHLGSKRGGQRQRDARSPQLPYYSTYLELEADGDMGDTPNHYTNLPPMDSAVLAYSNTVETGQRSEDETQEEALPPPVLVKPNETIEILVGADESPTLQATAHPWAPSEAAIAAAAAAAAASVGDPVKGADDAETQQFTQPPEDIETSFESPSGHAAVSLVDTLINDDDDDDDTNEDTDIGGSLSFSGGLGFDPTQNMDSVITSPTLRGVDNAENEGDSNDATPDPMDLAALSLGPASAVEANSGSNPFGSLGTPSRFLSSSMWGTSGRAAPLSMGTLANWDLLGASDTDASSAAVNSDANGIAHSTPKAASFLSLSPLGTSENTWGTGGLGGGLTTLGGTSLGTSHSNTKSSGPDTD